MYRNFRIPHKNYNTHTRVSVATRQSHFATMYDSQHLTGADGSKLFSGSSGDKSLLNMVRYGNQNRFYME